MKKKFWMLVPAMCLPYLALFAFFTPFTTVIVESVFQNNVLWELALFVILGLITLAVSIAYFVMAIRKGWDALTMAKYAMILKLAQIPAYIVIFVLGAALLITIFTMAISIGLWLLDCFTLFLSGLFTVAAVINSVRQGDFTPKEVQWFAVLQLFFCIDVVAAIVFYRKLKKKSEGE